MANVENTKAVKTEAVKVATSGDIVFTKAQIAGSVKYKDHRDLVNAILDDKKTYTFAEVDKIIDQYKKGVIK